VLFYTDIHSVIDNWKLLKLCTALENNAKQSFLCNSHHYGWNTAWLPANI